MICVSPKPHAFVGQIFQRWLKSQTSEFVIDLQSKAGIKDMSATLP